MLQLAFELISTQTKMFKLVVLSVVLALAVAEPSAIAPLWGGHLAAPWGAALAAPWGAAVAAPLALGAPIGAYNYRGPLSLAPGQPANILAADGRPLDTLSVNVDRAAHLTAKALDHVGAHLLKKRSIVAIAAPIVAPIAAAPLAPVGAYNYRGPLSLAPGQPANILAHDGRPLDTLSVNVDRAIHYTAKALDHGGAHLLKKRSVVAPWAAAPWAVAAPAAAWSHSARIDVPAARIIAPAPVALAAAAHVAPWGLGHGAPLGHHW
ncbi:uncharacterized protein LOC126774601 [Nymphalis io]|uniref:uncharacterized protein LOC126774601 n=1 Tax=Inachis io TaxID=171585 RepID=UPI00216725B3|nr:uncharacterized protein LOC126774601 [Nymphalis io]